jgi:hypothetical protein
MKILIGVCHTLMTEGGINPHGNIVLKIQSTNGVTWMSYLMTGKTGAIIQMAKNYVAAFGNARLRAL